MGQETGSYWTDIFSPEEINKYPVTLGEGGAIVSLPPYVVSETGIGQGTFGDLFGAESASVLTPFTPPQSNVGGGGALVNRMPVAQPLEGNDIYTQIYNQELARRNSIRQAKGELPIAAYDTAEINQLADWARGQVEAANQQQQAEAALAARNAAASSGQLGIPLVLPLPVDPITGLAITTAGLIASRGNIAKLDPSNPVGSLVGAAEGTINTIGSIPGQIAGAVGMGSTTGTQTGAEGTGTAGEQPSGTILVPPGAIGGNSGNTGTTPGDTGTPSTGSSTPVVGGIVPSKSTRMGGPATTQPTDTTSTGNQTIPATGTVGSIPQNTRMGQPADSVTSSSQSIPATGTTTATPEGKRRYNPEDGTTSSNVSIPASGTVSSVSETTTNQSIPASGTVSATSGGAFTFPIFYGTQTSSYTPMATTPAQRDLQTELSKSVPALQQYQPSIMGMYGDIYQNLLGQTAIPQAAQQSLSQMQADAAKLQRIQSGQLAAEDIRNAQQAAREAYAARGQVMGQGAIGAEILNREAIRQQRENEARNAYQASMGNVFNAAQLQTGNIFSPIGSLVSGTFNPLAAYEADIYGTNVNAINAAQIAEANRQAALESAKLGQTGTYAQALGTFLGSNTGSQFLKSLFG